MKDWLRETHGPGFELLRHFLRRFFDSDFVTTPDQTSKMLITGTPVFFQWFFLLVYPLKHKYAYLAGLPTHGPCRQAIQADELWLVTLMMSAIGLLTALKWQSLFPDLRDYRVLGSLPLRSRQIFGAKLAALVLVAMGALVTLNVLPSVIFPALSTPCSEVHSSFAARVGVHAEASLAASAFFFFGLVALQGVLLNLLPQRAFAILTRNLQGVLVAAMLVALVLSFSIQPQITNVLLQRARWLPPIWFLGFYQRLSGHHDPAMNVLAHRALLSLAIAIGLTLLTYLLSYRRRRALPADETVTLARNRPKSSALLNRAVPDPRQQAVLVFMMKTLARSSYHRVLVMSYAGFATAVLLIGLIAMPRVMAPERVAVADFIFYHMVTVPVLLIAARHIFSRPIELSGNWIFQITEREGRAAWILAMDRFVLFWGAIIVLIIPLPLEVRLLGWRGAAETILFMILGLLGYEWTFSSWEKLPFTCSYLPGKIQPSMILACLGLLGSLAVLHGFILAMLYAHIVFAVVLTLLVLAWIRVHRTRRHLRAELRLQYDDVPDPVVRELKLLR